MKNPYLVIFLIRKYLNHVNKLFFLKNSFMDRKMKMSKRDGHPSIWHLSKKSNSKENPLNSYPIE